MTTENKIKCIRKCGRKAGATPDLCYPCLKRIATEWFMFNSNRNDGRLEDAEIRNYFAKTYINRLQKRIRKVQKER